MPVEVSLGIIAEKIGDASIQDAVRRIRDDVKSGTTLGEALAKHPCLFSDLYVTVVKVGEDQDSLGTVLVRLATYLEKAAELRAKILGGILVPAVVAAVAGLAGLWLLHANAGIGGGVAATLAVILCALPVFIILAALPTGRFLPGVRSMIQKVDLARFARTMGTLARSGVPILEALEVTARSALNPAFGSAIRTARERLRSDGSSIARVMMETGAFPPMVVQMVGAGEETGKLDDMLLRIADFYDSEAETMVDRVNRAAATVLTFTVAVAMALLVQGWIVTQIVERFGK
jgi:type IV pilus assembly protein PilC